MNGQLARSLRNLYRWLNPLGNGDDMISNYQQKPDPTPRQLNVLNFIVSYLDDNGYPPTHREIASDLHINSSSAVVKHLRGLEAKGYIRRTSVCRGIALAKPMSRSLSVPIARAVRAGHPSNAIEGIDGYFSVDHDVVSGTNCFFLNVSGGSMVDKGIFDGDLALVRPQPTAENQDVVVAMLDGEAALTAFFREADHIRLQPANTTMPPTLIRPENWDAHIVGKVIGVYRKLE